MAERIGELLVRIGAISAVDVERGMSDARASRIRLASALVRLGKITADEASRALAEQHGVPAALSKHLEGRDLALAPQVPAELARELCALPLAMSRAQDAMVVCVRDPRPETAAALTRAIGKPIVLAVAVECALEPLVAETYPGLAPEDEFDVDVDSGVPAVPDAMPMTESGKFDVGSMELVELDHHGVSKDHSQVGLQTPALPRSEAPKRPSGPFAALTPPGAGLELPDRPSDRPSGRMPAVIHSPNPKVASEAAPPPSPRRLTLDAALVAITRAETRDFIVESLIAFLRFRFDAGVLFVVKDGCALGQAGFGGDLDDDAINALVMPLNQRSVLRSAHDEKGTYLGEPIETGVVQERFFKVLGHTPRIVVVVPVLIKGRVINLIYAHGTRVIPDAAAAAELRTLVTAVEESYVRIIREAKEA